MKMVAQPQTIFFHNANLSIVEHNGQPYVPMRPVVEGMGLAWQAQFDKLKQRFGSVIMEIMTTGKDGKQYQMLCLPLKKLFGWLMTISPNKVKPELRDTVIKYQEECDDVLWNHWTGKLNARHKAFDELNAIDMDDKISKAKGTLFSLGMHQRKREKKINKQKRQDWIDKNTLLLNFGADL
ncbi:phage antirepressor N-terminal domain-containing protein [Acinetobacter lwoffii]|nr:phage antirepressor N-terminal domain-containing protein [Acinetobacter lwoffii]